MNWALLRVALFDLCIFGLVSFAIWGLVSYLSKHVLALVEARVARHEFDLLRRVLNSHLAEHTSVVKTHIFTMKHFAPEAESLRLWSLFVEVYEELIPRLQTLMFDELAVDLSRFRAYVQLYKDALRTVLPLAADSVHSRRAEPTCGLYSITLSIEELVRLHRICHPPSNNCDDYLNDELVHFFQYMTQAMGLIIQRANTLKTFREDPVATFEDQDEVVVPPFEEGEVVH